MMFGIPNRIGTVCLMYHETTMLPHSKYSISIDLLEEHLKVIRDCGYSSFDPTRDILTDDNKVFLTFDDGHSSNLQAARILSRYGFKGTFYVIKEKSLTDSNYLSEDSIREIHSLGHTIAVHGLNHKHWTKKTDDAFIREFKETQDWIRHLTGSCANTCAAPGGVIDNRIIKVIKANFPEIKYIRTVIVGTNMKSDFLIKIAPIYTTTRAIFLKQLLSGRKFAWGQLIIVYKIKELVHLFMH